MKIKFSKAEKARFVEEMSSWENLSKVMYDWSKDELKVAVSVESATKKRKHILQRLVSRYNSVRAVKLD